MRVTPLTSTERAHLIDLYESEGWRALRKLMEQEQLDVAMKTLAVGVDERQLAFNQGKVFALKWISDEMQRIYKKHMNKGKDSKHGSK